MESQTRSKCGSWNVAVRRLFPLRLWASWHAQLSTCLSFFTHTTHTHNTTHTHHTTHTHTHRHTDTHTLHTHTHTQPNTHTPHTHTHTHTHMPSRKASSPPGLGEHVKCLLLCSLRVQTGDFRHKVWFHTAAHSGQEPHAYAWRERDWHVTWSSTVCFYMTLTGRFIINRLNCNNLAWRST